MHTDGTLAALRRRLTDASARIEAQPARPAQAGDAATQVLSDVDELLARTRALTSLLNDPDAQRWDELDDLLGRLVLRDMSMAAAALRRALTIVTSELEHADKVTRHLPDEIDSVNRKIAQTLERARERAEAKSGA